MTESKSQNPWLRFAGEMIVPVLLLGYASQYYISVARLPRPETNLLLIGPVYWLLLLCCLAFAGFRLLEILRTSQSDYRESPADPSTVVDPVKSVAFVVLTAVCIWGIPQFGFVTTTFAYCLALLLALGVRSPLVLVFTPSILVSTLWVGMEHYLNLRLPTGMLF
ncbi:hypothetical protein OS190_13645 [Sulfitobacter sp. F26204]|uniref:hypothetical protein n=1 Tax=Sulfitobacter sp. F26204 TaxID=2996014 RepID=UPI00225E2E60|nr:hypothetical protein [Sulfitobacter sp. F26204]MCX7560616.1 hypothetical protein [Sulfitobacter sp. F26204]